MILTRGLGVIRAYWRTLMQLSPIGLFWPAGVFSNWLWERIVLVELAGIGGVPAAMLAPNQQLLWHVWPSARLIGPALIVLAAVGYYRGRQAGPLAGAASVLGLLLAVGLVVWPEWLRLSSYLAHGYPVSVILPQANLDITAGAAFALVVAALGAYGLVTPFPVGARGRPLLVRAKSDNFGHAAWLSMGDAKKLFPGPDAAYGGIVVGEAYRVDEDRSSGRDGFKPGDKRSWGKGGRAPLLIDPCRHGPTHALVFAGSGGFKTTAVGVPTLLTWTGSAVVLDPSRELGPMLVEYRRRNLGHNVAMLDVATAAATGVNVLDWIDPPSPLAETHVEAVTGWIGGESCGQLTSGAEFFREGGRGLIACLLAYLLWDDALPPERKTLRELRRLLVTPEDDMRKLLEQVHALSSSTMARDLAGTLKGLVAETFSGVYANANKDTRWLSIPAYADLVSGGAEGTHPAFRTGDLCDGKLTVFIQIPLNALQATPAVGRVLVGSLLNAAYQSDGRVTGRILFMLDEVARLGYLQVLEQARDAGRK